MRQNTIIAVATITSTILFLGAVYILHLINMVPNSTFYTLFSAYGLIVTPFIMFKLAVAYKYKPVPDRGFRPSVSVVIPVYNEANVIAQTVNAIKNSNYPKEKLEIIVVNDGSTDNTFNITNGLNGIKLINFSENKGKRHAFAAGVQSASGELIVCVDSDSVVEQNALTNLVQPFTDPTVYCTCGHAEVLNADENILTHLQRVWYADAFRMLKSFESYFGMVTCCSGMLAAYRRNKLQETLTDLLNEKFMGKQVLDSDDRRLTNLLLKLNGKSKYQSNAVAKTVVPNQPKKFIKQQVRWGRGSFRGMLYANSYFYKRPTTQKVMFYLLILVNYLSPVVLLLNLVVFPLIGQTYLYGGLIYLAGLLAVNFFIGLNNIQLVKNFKAKDLLYRTGFVFMSIVVSVIYLYAWSTAWKGKKWMTR